MRKVSENIFSYQKVRAPCICVALSTTTDPVLISILNPSLSQPIQFDSFIITELLPSKLIGKAVIHD